MNDLSPACHSVTFRERPVSFLLIALVRLYKAMFSRFLGGHCKFVPTCSTYFIEAVTRTGPVRGTASGLWRICRCNPFGKGGYDPVKGIDDTSCEALAEQD